MYRGRSKMSRGKTMIVITKRKWENSSQEIRCIRTDAEGRGKQDSGRYY